MALTRIKNKGLGTSVSRVNIVDTGTEGTKVAVGTTAQRGSTTGQWRFNTDTGYYEGINSAGGISSLEPDPTISSVDDTEVDSAAGGNQTIVVTGTNFSSGGTISFVGSSASFNAATTTFNSVTQVTAVAPKSSFLNAQEPYKVKFTSSTGKTGTSGNLINVDNAPSFGVGSGTLGTLADTGRASSNLTTVTATDAEGEAITFAKTAGTLPTGITLNSNGTWSGTANAESSNTTYNFTITATAGSKTTDRAYAITVNAPQVSTYNFTGSGQTFTAPAGVTSFIVHMWAAGGTGGSAQNSGGTSTGGYGGPGGYVSATIGSYSAGQTFGILVGASTQSTDTTAINSFGGGGNGGAKVAQRIGGSGGGRSEINIGSVGNTPNGTRILVAGGGGGGNAHYNSTEGREHGAVGGHPNGGNGTGSGTVPTGGTQSGGGSRGSGLEHSSAGGDSSTGGVAGIGGYATGGTSAVDTNYGAGGGGGGGYYGGGGGDGGINNTNAQSGAGGSSYANASYASSITYTSGSGQSAPQTSNAYYSSGIAAGGNGRSGTGTSGTGGGPGKVVIVY
jgi:hypothetical protein|tara:strand:- start:454 stop:2139 length:1686 start_codon:yes stop_codon:yes gene_type:complete